MADRTVSARLRLDIARWLADARRAEQSIRRIGDEAERTGRRANIAYEQMRGGADRLERQIRQLMETQREQTRIHREQSEQTRRGREETDRSRQAQDRFRRSTEQATRGMTANRSTLVSLIAAATAVAPAVVSATVAFGAFGVVAAPSIYKVVTAQEDLAAQWGTLSRGQKTSALLVRGLADDYKALAKAYEPQALAAFNTVVGTTRALLPRLGEVVDATGGDVQRLLNRFAAFTEERVGGEFLTWAGKEAPKALDVLGTTAVTAGDTVLDLVADLEPLAISMLQLTNGTLSVVNGLANLNPGLAQLAITALLLRAPLAGVVNGVGNMAGRMRAAGGAASGLSRSARLLNVVTAAGPNLYVAAGIGLGFLAFKAASAKTSAEALAESMRATHKATGNNLAGYQALINDAMPRLNAATATLAALERDRVAVGGVTFRQTSENVKAYRQASEAQRAMTKVIDEATRAQRNAIAGADQLARGLGLTRDEALLLADAAGVDLSQSLDKNGQLSAAAMAKIMGLKKAMDDARNPALVLGESFKILSSRTASAEQRAKALAGAYNAELGPATALFNANMALKDGYAELSEELKRNKARMDGSSSASRQLQQTMSAQIDRVWRVYEATYNQTKLTGKASAAVRNQIPLLYALAGRNDDLRRMVDALARSTSNATGATNISRKSFLAAADSMHISRSRAESLWREYSKLPGQTGAAARGVEGFAKRTENAMRRMDRLSPDIDLSITAKGSWSTRGPGMGRTRPFLASGGPVPAHAALGPGGPTSDDVPLWASVDEHMVTAAEVKAVGGHQAMYRLREAMLRGDLRGFAHGGPVRGYATGGPIGMRASTPSNADMRRAWQPINVGAAAMVDTVARTMAAAWKRYATSGGPVVAAARSQIGVPYVFGGTAWDVGLDCSGLTMQAWRRGGGKNIGRTTYDHRRTLASISTPIPGAIGQPHSGHEYMYAGAGRIIEAPRTGLKVREVALNRATPWWGYPRAQGGPVTAEDARLADRALRPGARRDQVLAAKALGLAGDPGGLGLPGYQTGGWVTGRAGLAHAGEYVVNARSARLYGPLVEAINTGRPMIATGVGLSRGGSQAIDRHTEINVARMEVRDAVDLDLLAGRVAFHAWASSFGEN